MVEIRIVEAGEGNRGRVLLVVAEARHGKTALPRLILHTLKVRKEVAREQVQEAIRRGRLVKEVSNLESAKNEHAKWRNWCQAMFQTVYSDFVLSKVFAPSFEDMFTSSPPSVTFQRELGRQLAELESLVETMDFAKAPASTVPSTPPPQQKRARPPAVPRRTERPPGVYGVTPLTWEDVELLVGDRAPEDEHRDYKAFEWKDEGKTLARVECSKDVAAFANADGGYIIVGIQEKPDEHRVARASGFAPLSWRDPAATVNNWLRACLLPKELALRVQVERVAGGDRAVVVVSVPRSDILVVVDEGHRFSAPVRKGAETTWLTFDEILERRRGAWDAPDAMRTFFQAKWPIASKALKDAHLVSELLNDARTSISTFTVEQSDAEAEKVERVARDAVEEIRPYVPTLWPALYRMATLPSKVRLIVDSVTPTDPREVLAFGGKLRSQLDDMFARTMITGEYPSAADIRAANALATEVDQRWGETRR